MDKHSQSAGKGLDPASHPDPQHLRLLGLGEVLWDLLPAGPQLGGAPANFAYHARALGAEASVITRVGQDRAGDDILKRLNAWGIGVRTVQVDDEKPTGTVTVALSEQGVPTFTIHEGVAWDRIHASVEAIEAAKAADAICFGSLAQRTEPSRTSIQKLVSSTRPGAVRVFDINLRQSYYTATVIETSLGLADVLKLNDAELPVLARLFGLSGSPRTQIEALATRWNLRVVALTRGAEGSLLYAAGAWSERPAVPVRVVDTVGAGDAFTAGLVIGLLQGRATEEIHDLAGEVARFVCSQPGATPALPRDLCERFKASTTNDH